jgi:hypothetical protein
VKEVWGRGVVAGLRWGQTRLDKEGSRRGAGLGAVVGCGLSRIRRGLAADRCRGAGGRGVRAQGMWTREQISSVGSREETIVCGRGFMAAELSIYRQ